MSCCSRKAVLMFSLLPVLPQERPGVAKDMPAKRRVPTGEQAEHALGMAVELPDDAVGVAPAGQSADLVPGHRTNALLGHAAEGILPLAAGGEVVVEHPQDERPVDALKGLPQLLEVPEEVAFDAPAAPHSKELQQIEDLYGVHLHGRGGQEQQAPGLAGQARPAFRAQ